MFKRIAGVLALLAIVWVSTLVLVCKTRPQPVDWLALGGRNSGNISCMIDAAVVTVAAFAIIAAIGASPWVQRHDDSPWVPFGAFALACLYLVLSLGFSQLFR